MKLSEAIAETKRRYQLGHCVVISTSKTEQYTTVSVVHFDEEMDEVIGTGVYVIPPELLEQDD